MVKRAEKRLLARTHVATVEQCVTGSLQVTVGFVSLQLAPDALQTLAATLQDALRQKAADEVRERQEMRLFLGDAVLLSS